MLYRRYCFGDIAAYYVETPEFGIGLAHLLATFEVPAILRSR